MVPDILIRCLNYVKTFRISLYSLRYIFGFIIIYFILGNITIIYSNFNNDCSCDCVDQVGVSQTQSTPLGSHSSVSEMFLPVGYQKILNQTRMRVKFDLRKYNFSSSGARNLEDLLVENNGHPIRNIIVSTWRSGSTFFAEIVSAVPGTFYHYEPLLVYGIKQMRKRPDAAKALDSLRNMFLCNFSRVQHYFMHGAKHPEQFHHNTVLWEHCKDNRKLCQNVQFTNMFCKLFPFQSMKVLRVRLSLVESLLEDIELNLRVILLVRDPRGLMYSRRHWQWCVPADCADPELVCQDMVSNYQAARRLSSRYPTRIMVLRYEDLTLNLTETTRRVLKFLRLDFTSSVEEYLHAHGNFETPGLSSTFRISQDMPFRWKTGMDFESVEKIQDVCKVALHLFGYKLARNESHMASDQFHPLQRRKWQVRPLKKLQYTEAGIK